MATYTFCCPSEDGGCDAQFDVVASMSEIPDLIPECPACNNKKTRRDYSAHVVHDGIFKTVGMLAERNAAKYSDEYKQHLLAEQKTKKIPRKTGKSKRND